MALLKGFFWINTLYKTLTIDKEMVHVLYYKV